MVCAAALMTKERVTESAAATVALPAWLAVTVQVPTPSSVALLLATVQTAGVDDTRATARPELALATSATGVGLKVWFAGAVKVSVCGAGAAGSLLSPPPPQAASSAPSEAAQADHNTRLKIEFITALLKVVEGKPLGGSAAAAAAYVGWKQWLAKQRRPRAPF